MQFTFNPDKHYNSGKPCRHHHTNVIRYRSNKKCVLCVQAHNQRTNPIFNAKARKEKAQ